MSRQKITPCLWFDGKAREAAEFYVSIFKDSAVTGSVPGPGGAPLVVTFRLAGTNYIGLNGGPDFRFNEAVSLSVDCETQAEVDEYWEKLAAGGEEGRCGWLKDRHGLSWQIVPNVLTKLLADPDPAVAGRVMRAVMTMSKLDVQALNDAAAGG